MKTTSGYVFIGLVGLCAQTIAAPVALYHLPGELKAAFGGQAVIRTIDTNAYWQVTGSAISVVEIENAAERFRVTSEQALRQIPNAAGDQYWTSFVHQGFGTSAHLDGNHLVVGTPGNQWYCDCSVDPGLDVRGRPGSVFAYDAATGRHQRTLSPPAFAILAQQSLRNLESDWIGFGATLSVRGDLLLTGRRAIDLTTGTELFTLERQSPEDLAFTNAMGTFVNEDFGGTTAINSDLVLLNRSRNRETYNGDVGVYDAANGRFQTVIASLPSSAEDRFGISMAVQNDLALIGAPGDAIFGRSAGSAYLFDLRTGEQILRLAAPGDGFVDMNGRNGFGASVAFNGNFVLVGAPFDSQLNHENGAAYLYDVRNGDLLAKFLPDSPAHAGRFGSNVALTDGYALIQDYGFKDSRQFATTYIYAIPEPSALYLIIAAFALLPSAVRQRSAAAGSRKNRRRTQNK